MAKIVNIDSAKGNERIENKQSAKYVIITMREIMKQEQNIIDEMESILTAYDWENNELIKAGADAVEEYFKNCNNDLDTKAIDRALNILGDLVAVMASYKLLVPAGTYEARDIRRKYEDKDND